MYKKKTFLSEDNLIANYRPSKQIDIIIRTAGTMRLSDGPLIGISQSKMYPIEIMNLELSLNDIYHILSEYRSVLK
jgi:undecaprenyl pyrophosphate synthase